MRYQFVEQHKGAHSVSVLCRILKTSRNGYYAWKSRPTSKRQQADSDILKQIKRIHNESKESYGSPRIWHELKDTGIHCGLNKVCRLMQKHKIAAAAKKRYVVTTDSNHSLPVAENLVDQQFTTQEPNAVWSADFTYIWTSEGWLYLAVVLDLCSRRIVGWGMQSTMERSLVIQALTSALKSRCPPEGLTCHSDRGSQYASQEYRNLLDEHALVCSMSRKGNCYDNAPVESFFASLKKELVYRTCFATRETARTEIFEWIEVWYNRKRRHSALGYCSPSQFEEQLSEKRHTA